MPILNKQNMNALQLISEEILPLYLTDSANEALSRMNEYKVSHYPVVDGGKLVGVITEKSIFNYKNQNSNLQHDSLYFDNYYINQHGYIYDILKLFYVQKLTLLPVVDEHNAYIGSITQQDVISFLSRSMSINSPGGVIVLAVSENDYSLTEIANIVESNNAKVLSTNIMSEINSTKLKVIIKVSKLELSSLLHTFERYGYQIDASFGENIDYTNIKDNYDSLINYLNV